jgi:hypothetical protein
MPHSKLMLFVMTLVITSLSKMTPSITVQREKMLGIMTFRTRASSHCHRAN